MKRITAFLALVITPGLALASYFERIDDSVPAHLLGKSGAKNLQAMTATNSQFAKQKESISLRTGVTHTRYQQEINGIPVWTGELIVHSGNTSRMTGKVLKDFKADSILKSKHTEAEVSQFVATLLHKKHANIDVSQIRQRSVKPYIYRQTNGALVHAFLVESFVSGGSFVSRPMHMVRGADLVILKQWDAIQHLEVTGTGPGGNSTTGKYHHGESKEYPGFLVQYQSGFCTMENDRVKAVDLKNTKNDHWEEAFSYFCTPSNQYENTYKFTNGANSPINDAFFFGNLTFDLYQEWFQVKPLGERKLSMKVHYGEDFANAFWDGQSLVFGDGNLYTHPLIDVNVSAHEVSHGFTEFNSNLIYEYQSGGMNEAFSDMAGEAAEYFQRGTVDWMVGADIAKKPEDVMRYFDRPEKDGHSISHRRDYNDDLDVHLSSGIYNHAFYLLANTNGWDVKKAFTVFVYANQNYWGMDETFNSGACGVINSTRNLGFEVTDVINAFDQVGVYCSQAENYSDKNQNNIPDVWEDEYGFHPDKSDVAEADFDGDGISNKDEYKKGLNPKSADSDLDGLNDQFEINLGFDPLNKDSDGDGMEDGWEHSNGLKPLEADGASDLDNDSLSNLFEFVYGMNPKESGGALPKITSIQESFENGVPVDWNLNFDAAWTWVKASTIDGGYVLKSGKADLSTASIAELNMLAEKGENLAFNFKKVGNDDFVFAVIVNGELEILEYGLQDWRELQIHFKESEKVKIEFIFAQIEMDSEEKNQYVTIDDFHYSGAVDSNKNGIDDRWESYYKISSAGGDNDADKLSNLREYQLGTSPIHSDTDGDFLSDSVEIDSLKSNPLSADTDKDGMADGFESAYFLDLKNPLDAHYDTDSDGYSNLAEFWVGTGVRNGMEKPSAAIALSENFDGSELIFGWNVNAGLSQGAWQVVEGKLQSGIISNHMHSDATFTGLFEKGTITFDVAVATEEDSDYLEVELIQLDGMNSGETLKYSGGIEKTIEVDIAAPGLYLLILRYVKDGYGSSVEDRVAIDNFSFVSQNSDIDGDGLSNEKETELKTDPRNPDTDGDMILDGEDAFPLDSSESKDSDGDGYGDNIDAFDHDATEWKDSDGDGVGDEKDVFPDNGREWADTDGDGYGDNADDYPSNPDEYKENKKDDKGFLGLGSIHPALILLLMLVFAIRRNRTQ